jgi:hypothetical protein
MLFANCDVFKHTKKLKSQIKIFSNYTFTCFEEIENVPENEWNEATDNNNLFLSFQYLSVLDKQKTDCLKFRYVIVYHHKKPMGVVYFQINDFSASLFGEQAEKLITDLKNNRANLFQRYINENETVMRLVTCGNNFISGEHGFYLNVSRKKTTFKILETIINCVSQAEKLRGKISVILVKDFYAEGFEDKDCWYYKKFIYFNVEPNMIINLPKGLLTLTDYLTHFSKKYRNRAKHILESSASLTKKRLSTVEIIKYNDILYTLYLQVFEQAKFKLAHLGKDYFSSLANYNHTNFYIDAWFKGEELVSFASGFRLPTEIEAHFIGFDYKLNREYELYQTILYSYIEEGIALKKEKINLGRTASEIKSTVGAKANELICYIKPQNVLSKLILKPFMQFLQPSEWIPRNPFKEEHK